MAFSLIDETEGAVPIAALTKGEFPAWLEKAPERERNWLTSIGFSAEAGKHALVPGETGKLARVLVGLGDGATPKDGCGRSPGCRRRCRKRAIGSMRFPTARDPTRLALGWALGDLCLHPLSRKAADRPRHWCGPKAPIAVASSGSPAAVFLARDLVNTPAEDMGPEELAGDAPTSPRPPARSTASSSATTCSPRTTRRSTPSAAPARARRGWSTSSGAIRRRPR